MAAVDPDQAALADAHAAVGAADLAMIVAGYLALALGLDNREDGFAPGGIDDPPIQVHRHVGPGQGLDIELLA
ncbi:protein of unknown function [Pseudomonas mediterranea]